MLGCGILVTACDDSQSSAVQDAGSPADASAAPACMVTAPTVCPAPMPHYADVQPILQQRCVVCHSGLTERWPLTMYQDVADWYDTIRDDLLHCTMPPPEAAIPMTNQERLAILTWIQCGYPK
ncbi:MAG TPA: hypothetical protein PLW65_08050 [Pseudomonadota bacterium]|nr:hypothetical protein [Pseudomonadota bacterium]